MKILYVTTISRTMKFFPEHVKMLCVEGHQVDFACNVEDKSHIPVMGDSAIYNIPFSRSPLHHDNLKAYKMLKEVIENGNYDIIHTHTPNASAIVRLVCRKYRKNGLKVFYTAHGFHFYKGAPLKNWLLYYPVEKVLSRWTDCLITINKEDYERAKKKFHAKKVEYVPGVGIDVSHFEKMSQHREQIRFELREELGIPQDAYVLLSVGELNHNKNHQIVIRALAELNDPDMYYVICGHGELMVQHKQLATSLGVGRRVILVGFRKDVGRFYQMADLFVFPSLREGLGLAAIEAMASGLPIITSDVHGINDYSEDGVTGYKCSRFNMNQYAEAIAKLKKNMNLYVEIKSTNIKRAEKYSYKGIVSKIKSIYSEI